MFLRPMYYYTLTLADKIIYFALVPVASLGFMVIIMRAVFQPALSDFGEMILNAVTIVAVLAMGIVLSWFMFRMTGRVIYVSLILPIFSFLTLFIGLRGEFKKYHYRKFAKPDSEDYWICRRCGANNESVFLECQNCHTARG